MKEQLGTDQVAVFADGVRVGLQKYQIPFKARTFILNFDSGLPVDPLAFLMEADPGLRQPVVQRGGKKRPTCHRHRGWSKRFRWGYVTTEEKPRLKD